MKEISDFSTSVMWWNVKLIHMWRNFRFLLICHVQKFEISPHDRFFLHGHRPCVRDKYQVCTVCIAHTCKRWRNFRFVHICDVEILEISPYVEKLQISPYLSQLEIWNFSTWQISLQIYWWYRWQIWGMCQLYICAFYTPIQLKNVQDKFFLVLCNWENSIKRTKTASSGGVTQAVWNSANRVVPDGWLWHLWADQGSARLTSPAAQYRPNKPELQFNAQKFVLKFILCNGKICSSVG